MKIRNPEALASSLGDSATSLLEPEVGRKSPEEVAVSRGLTLEAREIMFEKILDQLVESSLFSSTLSPTIFIAYAHNNEKEGLGYDECVRKLITWLERIHVQIMSDHSPLPPFVSKIEGTDAIGNILANQMCLLPPSCYGTETPKTIYVDKVIVCGSEVMEGYCRKASTAAYIEGILQICTNRAHQPTKPELESAIRERVEKECGRDDFHHILTELAFLEARKSGLPETHGIIPVVLNQKNPDEAPMRYLPVFQNTDVKLKLKSPAASSLHRLFFKLLKRLFPDDRDFVEPFRKCYDCAIEDHRLDEVRVVNRKLFDESVNQRITKAYQEYWKLFCIVVRDGKLRAYTGKLSDQVSKIMNGMSQSAQHEILRWVSPISASELHGKYHDAGTSRLTGTCDWVIQHRHFRRWHASEGSSLLFLRGEMGTGKTYCISRVVDWVKKGLETNANDEAFAYFYCNKQDPSLSEPKKILRNIIRQLATGPWTAYANDTVVHKTVHELWGAAQRQGISSTFAEWEACLLALINTYPRTTIVLDALDECDGLQKQDLINLLTRLGTPASDSKPVKVFVSSRPQEDVRRSLDIYPVIQMQERRNAQDIASFVRAKIAGHRRWSKMPQGFQKEIIEKLLEKSGNMFLFASLQIQQLLNCNTQTALRNHLSKLPKSLNVIYEEIYDRATSDPDERKLVDRALRWVLCSARPLSTDELLFAISQDPESDCITSRIQDVDEELILLWAHNLLYLDHSPSSVWAHKASFHDDSTNDSKTRTVPRHNDTGDDGDKPGTPGVWRLAHQAVATFLEESTCCDPGLGHNEAAKVCLMFLIDTFGADSTETQTIAHEVFGDDKTFQCPCRQNLDYPESRHIPLQNSFGEYAVHGWPTHVRAGDGGAAHIMDGLSKALQNFLGQPEEGSLAYKRWLRHASEHRSKDELPKWSIFQARPMPSDCSEEAMTRPITLACHFGIYTTLLDWWDTANVDFTQSFDPLTSQETLTRKISQLRFPRLRWSLVALACFHGETHIVKHLLKRQAQVNTGEEDEVPPIVAAAVADSAETVSELIERGANICSPFTARHGHLLRVIIRCNSLRVLGLVLQQPAFSQAQKVAEGLRSVGIFDFQTPDAMRMLIDMGVDVNSRLDRGTLLAIAACEGWEEPVRMILDGGGDVNAQIEMLGFKGLLEAVIARRPSLSIITLLVEHGVHVNSCAVTEMWALSGSQGSRKSGIELLLGCKPDLNETWTDWGDRETSALIEAVRGGDLDQVRLLVQHGADASLRVKGEYNSAMDCVFGETLERCSWETKYYPTGPMIDALVDAGASLGDLKGDHLNNALAAVAFAGVADRVEELLGYGASPNACCDHQWYTALGAATASGHPLASEIVDTLLDRRLTESSGYKFFQNARVALDQPLLSLIDSSFTGFDVGSSDLDQLKDSWLRSACALALHNAVWDINFKQWKNCLKLKDCGFWEQNSELLDQLQTVLKGNRKEFFLKFPGAASEKEWSIKGAWGPNPGRRKILMSMRVLRYS